MENTLEDNRWIAMANAVTPGGANTLSRAFERFPVGAFPAILDRGDAAHVYDVNGRKLIDWIGSLGACPLGHNHPMIANAVCTQIRAGSTFSLSSRVEIETSDRICKLFEYDMVRWVSSGSEACTGAMRTARSFTDRPVILVSDQSYHGWHDGFAASKEVRPGIPIALTPLIRKFIYNDLDSLEHALHPGDVAAVLMEPTLWEKPKDGFLQSVKEIATRHGAVFILDEMIMGLRMALRGGSEYFNIKPDIACYGKSLANGLPVACILGRRDIMEHSWFMSGTFSGNALSLAAANAVLDVYESEPVIETMWKRGREFQDSFNSAARNLKVEAECIGYPCKPKINFTQSEGDDTKGINQLAMSLFLQVAAEYGMLWHPGGGNVCYALTDEDMDITKFAITQGLGSVRNAIWKNDWSELKGTLIKPVVTVRQ